MFAISRIAPTALHHRHRERGRLDSASSTAKSRSISSLLVEQR